MWELLVRYIQLTQKRGNGYKISITFLTLLQRFHTPATAFQGYDFSSLTAYDNATFGIDDDDD